MSQSADIANQDINCETSENTEDKNRHPEKLNFNLDAAEYKPKELIEYFDEVEAYEEEIQDQIDKMIEKEEEKEIIAEFEKQINLDNDDDDSEDEDKWIPKYRNCECCYGFVYNCKGKICASLGQCYCKMEDEMDSYHEKLATHEKENIKENKKCENILN